MEKIAEMMKFTGTCMVLVALMLFCGCVVDNNYLSTGEFGAYLEKDGIKVEKTRELRPDPFRATSGTAYLIAGSEIGVYKYDQTSKIQQDRLARIKEKGRTYINGVPYPVEIYGSFMFFGLEKNPRKRDIMKTIRKFK